MAKLTLIITESVPISLRGQLTKWMLELKPGVFIGTISAVVREKLWLKVCDKLKNGGAFLINSYKNEQKFKIKMHGYTNRLIVDYDGLQLIRIPLSLKSKIKEKINVESRLNQKIKKSPVLFESPLPQNFIERTLKVSGSSGKFNFLYGGESNFHEYSQENIWSSKWTDDLEIITKKILEFVKQSILKKNKFINKNIISIDIATTDYLQKAYEGFVNIIGMSCLNLRDLKQKSPSLQIYQIFNMTRKKKDVHNLIRLVRRFFDDIDILIVFNRDFDIKILQKVIKNYEIDFKFPDKIIDLMKRYPSLQILENDLFSKTGFHRNQTEKGKYSQYYSLFKGKGIKGINKQIEPIGAYNLIDTLTPLFSFLITEFNKDLLP